MKEQDNFNNSITNQSNITSLLSNDNNKQFSNNNSQLNNFKQIPYSINSNLNLNNLGSLNQNENINNNINQIFYTNNINQNINNQHINEFPFIKNINPKKDEINNHIHPKNININKQNNIYNNFNNYYNNSNKNIINNYYIGGNNIINKTAKPYFTSKRTLLNAYSLDKINNDIQKDLLQLEKFLPNYKQYISSNNSESINICLKYIEYTNFFFSQIVTKKVNDIFKTIIYSDDTYNQNNESFNSITNKIKELYNKLIPYEFRVSYLNAFYENNSAKKLYNLFINDLNKYQKCNDKKYYLYEIFEIVKQKMDNKDKEEIKNYFNKLFSNQKKQNNNTNFNNLLLSGNNGINNNGGNYENEHSHHYNNNSHQYRK